MPTPREVPAAAPSRRALLRLLGVSGLAAAGSAGLAGCSAADREALRAVDLRRVRLDSEAQPGPGPAGPSARERRRRTVRGGSLAALAALEAAAGAAPPLVGRTGGAADPLAAAEVHRVHAAVLAGSGGPARPLAADLLRRRAPADGAPGGPVLVPAARPEAVLAAGYQAALAACAGERAAEDAQVPLALLHARVAAARSAQAVGLRGTGATPLVWPTTSPGPVVVDALQGLLAQEHRARWSYAVVLAWSSDRTDDAATARAESTSRSDELADLLRLLGAEPVGPAPTYPTDDQGRPVDGPAGAVALALRLEDATAVAAAALLAAAVHGAPVQDAGTAPTWLRAAVRRLAEAERARWSWGGAPVPWPGGTR